MKCLMEWLQDTYNNLKDKHEIIIYNKYGEIAKRITIIFTSKRNDKRFWLIWSFINFSIVIEEIIIFNKD